MKEYKILLCNPCAHIYALLGTVFIATLVYQLWGLWSVLATTAYYILYQHYRSPYPITLVRNDKQWTVVNTTRQVFPVANIFVGNHIILINYRRFHTLFIRRSDIEQQQQLCQDLLNKVRNYEK